MRECIDTFCDFGAVSTCIDARDRHKGRPWGIKRNGCDWGITRPSHMHTKESIDNRAIADIIGIDQSKLAMLELFAITP